MIQNYKYIVATRCLTYNHAPYIEEALSGFAMQETSFPIVFIIVDDASTDGEQDVIRQWATNNLNRGCDDKLWQVLPYGFIAEDTLKCKPNSHFVILLLSENHYQNGKRWEKMRYTTKWVDDSKYYATCEGDDYWISNDKLQKQVDFLEAHPEYSVCVHNFRRYWEKDGSFSEGYRYKKDFTFGKKEYLRCWPTHPMTSVVRTSALPSIEARKLYKYYRDNHHFYLLLQKGLGYYMADIMGVYRVSNKGIWTSLNQVSQIEIDLKCYLELYQYNKADKDLKNKCINQYVLYLQTCKENNAPVKKEVKDLMWQGGKFKAKVIILYSRLRKLIVK